MRQLVPAVRVVCEALALHPDDTESLACGRPHHDPPLEPLVDRRAKPFEACDFGRNIVGLDVDVHPALMVDALDLDADLVQRPSSMT